MTLGVFNSAVSPLVPRSSGVNDLTRVPQIMKLRRETMEKTNQLAAQRYASIPALFFNADRSLLALPPSLQMSSVSAAITAMNLMANLIAMEKSHDGIVTEKSNDICSLSSHEWPEVRLTTPGTAGEPSRCHATIAECSEQDHCTVTGHNRIARLVWLLLSEGDWRVFNNPSHPQYKKLHLIHCKLVFVESNAQ